MLNFPSKSETDRKCISRKKKKNHYINMGLIQLFHFLFHFSIVLSIPFSSPVRLLVIPLKLTNKLVWDRNQQDAGEKWSKAKLSQVLNLIGQKLGCCHLYTRSVPNCHFKINCWTENTLCAQLKNGCYPTRTCMLDVTTF